MKNLYQTWVTGGSGYAVLQNELIVYNRMFNDSIVEDDEIIEDDKEDKPIIDITGKANGVYVVTADGQLVDTSAATADCIGVAFISDNQKVMIAKADANSTLGLRWSDGLYKKNVPNLEDHSDDTAAKADYNGKANTAAIIAGYAALGKNMDSLDMCKALETYNEGVYTDWYVPAAGQLYELYSNKTTIDEALTSIGGTAFWPNNYWSSSENSANYAWYVNFSHGDAHNINKNQGHQVRFVRDL